ncbi:hypothetical protein OJAV_G00187490 [Oryzias javanicus]|uniref:Uncharacterized protein n=1 Tax=Oryzias javanicus TaxID=123683 RepID=A0A437CA58_ORYJA|nr:hypothetical protein OJAV_G00187490 [Oryzias javanicus]
MQQSNLRVLQAVMKPLEDGLQSFNRLSEMLLNIVLDIVPPGCQTFEDFRREVQKMEKYLNESEQRAGEELEQLDEKTEALTVDKYALERKRKEQEAELARLKTCVDSHESSLKKCREARDAQQKNLKTAEKNLKEMEQQRDKARTIRDVGIGLFFVPFGGWIAGK